MRDPLKPRLSKWPFFLGDLLLLGAAYFIYFQSKLPMGVWEILFVVSCVAGAACLGIMPFLLEYRLLLKLTEARTLTTALEQMHNLETLSTQISNATGQWQLMRTEAGETTAAAKGIAERMTAEVKAFTEFMQRANDAERANLKLEVEKLRRAENDWLQALVRMLDHVYALHVGALRSGQPNLIMQLGNFQTACRDAARRVGLTPFAAEPSEPFDAQRHQRVNSDGNGDPEPEALIAETVATGYTLQGQLVRPALVRLQGDSGHRNLPVEAPLSTPDDKQSQLPLQQEPASPV